MNLQRWQRWKRQYCECRINVSSIYRDQFCLPVKTVSNLDKKDVEKIKNIVLRNSYEQTML